ncbi:MAG: TonB-dependent receptor [Rikenellaceae bacterium]
MKGFFLFILVCIAHAAVASEQRSDSLYVVEAVEVTAIKQGKNLRLEPLASSVMGSIALANNRVTAMKDVQSIVPNFYIPDYGSRITSSIYVRGLGARIDQPVVGLNIDNVPYLNKNAFDTNLMDISRMEILRGPQSTLYGRNTMGGVVNIYTLSPIDFEGAKVGVEYGNGNSYSLRGALYRRLSEIFALSASAYYTSTDGFYTNDYTETTCDTEREGGARLRMIHYPTPRTTIDNTLSFSILTQGGYAYRPLATDVISYNDPCGYDRTMVSNGLTISHKRDAFTISSITGYQLLDDEMRLDQDFTTDDIFTLKQAIREHSVTQDVVLRSNNDDDTYSYLFGAFGFFRSQQMDAPVTFEQQGIESLIFANVSIDDGDYYVSNSDNFLLDSDVKTNSYGAALYHESSVELGRWELKGGVRIDYERSAIDYHSFTDASATRYNSEGDVVWLKDLAINLQDNMALDFFNILPKVSATYRIDGQNMLYGSLSRGYKSGGYNTQMLSDIIQQTLMAKFGLSEMYNAEDIISYRPEYSWNYELGGHFANTSRTLTADVALFYIDCYDQQVTVFPEDTVTGRMMTNAGRSRSYGAELSAMWRYGRWALSGSYGYTNAKFTEYDDNEEDYAGNYVPYAPQQTIYGSATYTIPAGGRKVERIEIEATTNGAGQIYWREDNSYSQPLYALLGGSVRFVGSNYTLSLWGKNLLNKRYDTFYFESMSNEYAQWGKPRMFGAKLDVTINRR